MNGLSEVGQVGHGGALPVDPHGVFALAQGVHVREGAGPHEATDESFEGLLAPQVDIKLLGVGRE
jgi:hypothetical protein